MQPVESDEFMRWVAECGIGVLPEYSKDWPRNISFSGGGISRYWTTDKDISAAVAQFSAIVKIIAVRSRVVLWPKCDTWLWSALSLEDSNPLARTILRDAARFRDHRGGFWFAPDEHDQVVSILAVAAAFGWSWTDDLYVVPDDRDAIVMLDHHDAVWIKTSSPARMEEVVESMSQSGYELPRSPPDSTFKPQEWMDQPRDSK